MDILLILLLIVVALPLIALSMERLADASAMRRYPPPGDLVDVAGMKIHVHCDRSAPVDGPTVVFDSGSGGHSMDWVLVREGLAGEVRCCAYDRPGNGWSTTVKETTTPQKNAVRLRQVLLAAEIPPPYVLVGQGLGAWNITEFAAAYPEEVAGLVFADAVHPTMFEGARAQRELTRLRRAAWLRRLGIVRLLQKTIYRQALNLPVALQPLYRAVSMHSAANVLREVRLLFKHGVQLPESLGDLPLIIIARSPLEMLDGSPTAESIAHQERQKGFLDLSSRAEFRIAERGGHYVQLDSPETVVNAVQYVLHMHDSSVDGLN